MLNINNIYILDNNIYMTLYPIERLFSEEVERGLLRHYNDNDDINADSVIGNIEEFDGISLIVWTENNKIMELKEFGCNLNTYNPYAQNDMPQFRDEKTKWF